MEMQIADVKRQQQPVGDQLGGYAVVLKEVGGTRQLVIWIGIFEAESLACQLEHIEFPRPLIYTLTARMLDATGGRLEGVRLVRLVDKTFYAELVIGGAQGQRIVDARPSDAFNLALIAGLPIHVAPAVLDAAAVPQDNAEDTPSREGLAQVRAFLAGAEGAAEIVAAAIALGRPQAPSQASPDTPPPGPGASHR